MCIHYFFMLFGLVINAHEIIKTCIILLLLLTFELVFALVRVLVFI